MRTSTLSIAPGQGGEAEGDYVCREDVVEDDSVLDGDDAGLRPWAVLNETKKGKARC